MAMRLWVRLLAGLAVAELLWGSALKVPVGFDCGVIALVLLAYLWLRGSR